MKRAFTDDGRRLCQVESHSLRQTVSQSVSFGLGDRQTHSRSLTHRQTDETTEKQTLDPYIEAAVVPHRAVAITTGRDPHYYHHHHYYYYRRSSSYESLALVPDALNVNGRISLRNLPRLQS